MRFEIRGMVGDEPRIVVEHVTRLRDEDAPDWRHGHGYVVDIEGPERQGVGELSSNVATTTMPLPGHRDARHQRHPRRVRRSAGRAVVLDLPVYIARHLMRGRQQGAVIGLGRADRVFGHVGVVDSSRQSPGSQAPFEWALATTTLRLPTQSTPPTDHDAARTAPFRHHWRRGSTSMTDGSSITARPAGASSTTRTCDRPRGFTFHALGSPTLRPDPVVGPSTSRSPDRGRAPGMPAPRLAAASDRSWSRRRGTTLRLSACRRGGRGSLAGATPFPRHWSTAATAPCREDRDDRLQGLVRPSQG